LAGADAVIVGAPIDELTSDRPGARFGPRAIRAASCPPGPHMDAKVDALRDALRVIDFGDAPVVPADPVRSHRAIEAMVTAVLAAGAMPVVLGGDHSIAEPSSAAGRGGDGRGVAGADRLARHHRPGGRAAGARDADRGGVATAL